MEPKFINQFDFTFKLYKEWMRNPVSHKGRRIKSKTIIYLAILLVVIVILLIPNYTDLTWFTLYPFFLLILFLISAIIIWPYGAMKIRYNKLQKSHRSQNLYIRYTFSDNILLESKKGKFIYKYSEILKTDEDKNYFYLFSSFDVAMRVRKDSFILGSCDEFRDFIDKKLSIEGAM